MSWIKLHRSLLNSPLWQDKPFARGQAWVDLLLLTNGLDRQELKKGRIVLYERGKVCRSVSELAERWGWSRKKVTTFLKLLESQGALELETTARGSIITIKNWEFYQVEKAKNGGATENSPKPQTGSDFVPDWGTAKEQPGNSSGTGNRKPCREVNAKNGTSERAAKPQTGSGFVPDWGTTESTTEEQLRNSSGTAERHFRNTKKNVTEKVENVIEPTTQQTTSMVVGTTGAGEVSRCVGGEASAVPSALDAEVVEDRYRYGDAIALYEKIKGAPMSPTELEAIMDMVNGYGSDQVLDALRITGQTEGCRSRIGYTQGILRNWKQNGRDSASTVMSEEERLTAIVRAMEEAERNG